MDTTPEDRYLELKGSFTAEQSERLPLEVQLYGSSLQELAANWKGLVDTAGSVNRISELIEGVQATSLKAASEAEVLKGLELKLERRQKFHLPARKLAEKVEAKADELAMLRLKSDVIYREILGEYSFAMSSLDLSDLVFDAKLEEIDPEDLRVPDGPDDGTHLTKALAMQSYLHFSRMRGYNESARIRLLPTMAALEHIYSIVEELPAKILKTKTPIGAR